MFGNWFGARSAEKKGAPVNAQQEALIEAVRERSKEDPLIGAKLGAKEVYQRLLNDLRSADGVHIESVLCTLGALAGYACQAGLRAQAFAQGQLETAPFQVIQTNDGKQYFFGDQLNHAIAGAQYSVWGIAGGAAQHAGAQTLPDLNEIFQHTAAVVGGDQFGIPRVPAEHAPRHLPAIYLKTFWPKLFPIVKAFCPTPAHWPILYGLAIQQSIYTSKDIIDPAQALRIVMESAVPMSKVDLARL
jgi:hypothetical protein